MERSLVAYALFVSRHDHNHDHCSHAGTHGSLKEIALRNDVYSSAFITSLMLGGPLKCRNLGMVDGNTPVSDNDWETVKRGGDRAIKRWIEQQIQTRSCTVVLVGSKTAGRRWITYEI